VAGIGVEGGKPFLAFFHRDLWKGRYEVDERKRDHLRAALGAKERRALDALLLELEQLERRKSTLLQVLEAILEVQAGFLVSRDPARRAALTQRELARRVGSDPSVVNRLLAGKSVELPWGLEAPLRAFAPSPKAVLKERLRALAEETPGASAEALRALLARRFGAKLSRRSVAQYLLELRGER
jgi:DNA-directed RNA polymerase specialized sigma54-like protein